MRAMTRLYGSEVVVARVREVLGERRGELASGRGSESGGEVDDIVRTVRERLDTTLGRRLTRMINATGILLHTNLGRAPLPREVAAALPDLLDAYCDLEIDRSTGRRGDRNRRAARLLEALTGAPAALVTNNNAAAFVLVLSTLASGREVLVSRGELVEIGGSFRIPEIMEAAGARLVEVGSTNRTRLSDYRSAVGAETALILKVHPSNYRITGFTEEATVAELVGLGSEFGLPVTVDEGSGLLQPSKAPQLANEASLQELLSAGCDLVCGSGDKLLGGPQAGLLLGRRDLVEACHRNPLYRALRPDRACFASLEAVLRLHLSGAELPLDRLWVDATLLRGRLEALRDRCGGEIVPAEAYLGGGAAPEAPIPGEALAIDGEQRLLSRLRDGDPAVVGYVHNDRVMLDLRTVDPADDEALGRVVSEALEEMGDGG